MFSCFRKKKKKLKGKPPLAAEAAAPERKPPEQATQQVKQDLLYAEQTKVKRTGSQRFRVSLKFQT
jgi:hypothetical protein